MSPLWKCCFCSPTGAGIDVKYLAWSLTSLYSKFSHFMSLFKILWKETSLIHSLHYQQGRGQTAVPTTDWITSFCCMMLTSYFFLYKYSNIVQLSFILFLTFSEINPAFNALRNHIWSSEFICNHPSSHTRNHLSSFWDWLILWLVDWLYIVLLNIKSNLACASFRA